MEPESRFYTSQRLKLHYVVWGDDTRPPILLVHGMRDHARNWDAVAERLVDHFAVYAVDLRGHGDSQWSYGSLYSIVDFVYDTRGAPGSIWVWTYSRSPVFGWWTTTIDGPPGSIGPWNERSPV